MNYCFPTCFLLINPQKWTGNIGIIGWTTRTVTDMKKYLGINPMSLIYPWADYFFNNQKLIRKKYWGINLIVVIAPWVNSFFTTLQIIIKNEDWLTCWKTDYTKRDSLGDWRATEINQKYSWRRKWKIGTHDHRRAIEK